MQRSVARQDDTMRHRVDIDVGARPGSPSSDNSGPGIERDGFVPVTNWTPGIIQPGIPAPLPDPMMMGFGFNPQFGFIPPGAPGVPMPPPPQKEIIHCKECTLFPANPTAPPPTTRERPPGCRTVFVGGLPEKADEEMIRDVFGRCGPVLSVRMSKKNFCHIRFEAEPFNKEAMMQLGENYLGENSFVDRALQLSGYRMRIGSNTDASHTGRLHVDFAQARDDLYEWECALRAVQREMRHRQRVEQDRMMAPSPPPVIHFSDHESVIVSDQLKNEETFFKASSLLITWLERGDCNRRSANSFYSMIQSTNSHVRRLMNEKQQYEEEMMKLKDMMKQRFQGLLTQFDQIDKVFNAATKQKAWDHFSKAQRKNIDLWRKQCQEIKATNMEEFLSDRHEDEMEMSDGEGDSHSSSADGPPNKKSRTEDDMVLQAQLHVQNMQVGNLKEENDQLRCQVDAYKNEVDVLKAEHNESVDYRDNQIKALQQTLEAMQKQIVDNQQKMKQDGETIEKLKLESSRVVSLSATKQTNTDSSGIVGVENLPRTRDSGAFAAQEVSSASSGVDRLSDKEARLVGLIATFLHVHPFGAGTDYIWSYLQRLLPGIRTQEIEELLQRLPGVFRQTLSGVGASLERRWNFTGFESSATS